jgi:hypothetical protein
MTHESIAQLSDSSLLAATTRVVEACRRSTAELIALLGEVDARKLYRGLGHASLFTYCTEALHLSEPAAYSRITAARVARRWPLILNMLAAGDVTLTTISLLAAHLTDGNHEAVLNAARHQSKRKVEELVVSIDPRPDIPSSVRRLPSPKPSALTPAMTFEAPASARPATSEPSMPLIRPAARAVVAPLAPDRYLVKITVGKETHAKLERARSLLRHAIPNGDPAAIVDRALTVLIEQLERSRQAKAHRPRPAAAKTAIGRHVPAAVKRAVWTRDDGRCAFVGPHDRCTETAFLELHHVMPFAAGGAATTENLQLRCRSHNAHEAELFFGPAASQLCPDRAGRQRTTVGYARGRPKNTPWLKVGR